MSSTFSISLPGKSPVPAISSIIMSSMALNSNKQCTQHQRGSSTCILTGAAETMHFNGPGCTSLLLAWIWPPRCQTMPSSHVTCHTSHTRPPQVSVFAEHVMRVGRDPAECGGYTMWHWAGGWGHRGGGRVGHQLQPGNPILTDGAGSTGLSHAGWARLVSFSN
jgi:hypothetical protein